MKNEKDLLHNWKIDLQIIKEEKAKNKERKKYKIGSKTEIFGDK
ncbi:hypothetical protein ACTIGL_28025 (plasmid) [Bacillus shihchuchen]|uniref:Uncharacterized protein n=1 Tax=Bacillus shihchuchen TaxID=3036942 RepID=A0ABT7L213_9BACI|nr:hypothetical protein [Bacillus shihchuchen]